MRKKRTVGIVIFVVGVLLKELSYIIDISIIHSIISVSATIIAVIGLVKCMNAMADISKRKEDNDYSQQSSVQQGQSGGQSGQSGDGSPIRQGTVLCLDKRGVLHYNTKGDAKCQERQDRKAIAEYII